MELTNKRIRLNWAKLLGYRQVKGAQGDLKSKAAKAMIGAKIGQKFGVKNTQP